MNESLKRLKALHSYEGTVGDLNAYAEETGQEGFIDRDGLNEIYYGKASELLDAVLYGDVSLEDDYFRFDSGNILRGYTWEGAVEVLEYQIW